MRIVSRTAASLVIAVTAVISAGPAGAATRSGTTLAQAGQPAGTISGRVADDRGNGLSGAAISITGGGREVSATTAGDGSFSVSVPPGIYSVGVAKGGFQSAQNDDIVVVSGGSLKLNITLNESNLQSLRVIGTVRTTVNRAPFNISESSISTLPPQEITLRQNNNLTDLVANLPGVVASRTFSATPNTSFVVRGSPLQTRVTIDGHPVSSGIAGQWNTNYAVSGIFNDVEVVKGTGLNGAIAGESAVGTVNLRTRDFTPKNSAGLQFGTDDYSGGIYNAYADVNFLKDKASIIVAKSFIGYNGPWNNYFGDRVGRISTIAPGVGQPPTIVGLDQWQGDLSNRYSLQAELLKARYRFSQTSSLTLEFLGMQGQYQPQGGAYSTYNGHVTLQACLNGSTFQPTLATCTAASTFTAPYTFNAIGQTVNGYTWFPQSYIQNNEPQFAAEFRTSLKNDTVLFRPYTHLINRFISGVNENKYPGNNGGWFAVTDVANCQVKTIAPGTAGGPATGAAGPCFGTSMTPNGPAYIGNDPTGHVFSTTSAAPACSPTPPFTCFTTPIGVQNDGNFGYGTPFSQPELDRLHGYTFTYIHPNKDNVFTFSYDYRKDFTQSSSTDNTPAGPGCSFVIGTVTGSRVFDSNGKLFQPGCTTTPFPATGSPYTIYNELPRSPVGVPPTVSQYSDFSLTAQLQLNDKLRLAIGNYFEMYKLNAQIEDPAVLAAFAARGNSNAAPVSLISGTQSYSHYDPHIGLEYRATPNVSLRANAGSSITPPFPTLVSGFGSISIPNAAAHNYTVTIPNFNLKPETTVSYDVGSDFRFADGAVFSVDAYHLTVHDVFLSTTTAIPPVTGVTTFPDTLFLQSAQINGPIARAYGLEFTVSKTPPIGLGYYLSATLSRTFNDQLPLSLYTANTTATNGNFLLNGAQIVGNPYLKAYGQLLFGGAKGAQFEFGADYEGNYNSTLGPPYVLYDAAARIPLGQNRVHLQVSIQNLTNYNTGTALGRNLSSQGIIQPTAFLSNGQLQIGGSPTSLQALPPRTARITLNVAL
ncbi:MAG: TonB-dependent receptor domain-containing protein [Candidatus Velthaea sp.]